MNLAERRLLDGGETTVLERSATQAVPIESARCAVDLGANNSSADDELFRLIDEATDMVERDCGIQCVPAHLSDTWRGFPGRGIPCSEHGIGNSLQLRRRPVVTAPVTLGYLDHDDMPASVDVVSTERVFTYVAPSAGDWPADATTGLDSVTAGYMAGMGIPLVADPDADQITTAGYRYRKNERIQFSALSDTVGPGLLPSPLQEATTYYVLGGGETFKVSAEPDGAAIDLTDTGDGSSFVVRVWPRVVAAILVVVRQRYDNQAGNPEAFDKAYKRLISRFRSPNFP